MVTDSNTPLRVWHIAELYPPDYGGGAAVYVRDVCRFLGERGHEIRVWCTENRPGPAYSVREERDGPVQLYRINLPHFRTKDPGGWLLGMRGWREHRRRIVELAEQVLGDWKPDLVNFHTPYSLFEECVDSIRSRSIPTVGMLHCAWLICPRMRLVRSPTGALCSGPGHFRCLECLYSHWDGAHAKALLKLPWRLLKLGVYPAYRLALRARLRPDVDGLIGYSQYMTDTHRGRVNGPVEHIPLGIDLAGVPAERPVRPRSPLRFGFAGGIQEHKGIWDVLDAAAGLKRRELPFQVHVWGPNQELAISAIASRGLQDCVFLRGMFTPEERWTAFAEFDVLLMATRDNEPYGRVIQEAAAAGAPSIAPDVAGIGEQIRNGVDGLLYKFRDRHDLERQMVRAVQEPGLVARLAAHLWQVVDTRDAVLEIERFYHQILDNRGKRTSLVLVDHAMPVRTPAGE